MLFVKYVPAVFDYYKKTMKPIVPIVDLNFVQARATPPPSLPIPFSLPLLPLATWGFEDASVYHGVYFGGWGGGLCFT